MGTDRITNPVIRAYDWNTGAHSKILSDSWKRAMENNRLSDTWKRAMENNRKISDVYSVCLQNGRETILEKMVELITNKTYFKPQPNSEGYRLNWREAPHCLAKFLQQLETVFTGNKRMKIRRNKLASTVTGVTTSAATTPTLPEATKYWTDGYIRSLYEHCEDAMKLLENNPAIISKEYKQCLQRGRDVIIKNMMEFIMDPAYFEKASGSTEYLFEWIRAIEALESFLQHSEAVFTRDEELQIREKRIVKSRSKTITIPSRASLLALVEAPEPRQKSGILRTYAEVESFSANNRLHLEMLQGKKILNGKWAEEGKSYELSGEANAMLCMHLWALMRYVGFSDSERIWEGIRRGWPECVSWKEGQYGTFWDIIQSDERPLRTHARINGLESILDAYEDIEGHFKKKQYI